MFAMTPTRKQERLEREERQEEERRGRKEEQGKTEEGKTKKGKKAKKKKNSNKTGLAGFDLGGRGRRRRVHAIATRPYCSALYG